MKKFCGIFFLLMALVFAGSQNNVGECRDSGIYVGTFRDGYDAYLVMSASAARIEGNRFGCTVMAVKGNDSILIRYDFWRADGWYFSNSQGFRKKVTSQTPVAQRILDLYISWS